MVGPGCQARRPDLPWPRTHRHPGAIGQIRRRDAEGRRSLPGAIAALNLAGARRLYATIPGALEARQIVQQPRAANATLDILARARSSATVEHFERLGANLIVPGETEIAHRMLERGRTGPSPASD